MVTMNPNWSTEIIWYETDYAKGKIISPLKCPTLGRLYYRFCLKLLKICCIFAFDGMLIIFLTLVSFEYSTTNTSNPSIDKYYVKKYGVPDFVVSVYWGSR